MSESLAKEFFPSSNGMRPNTASFTSNGLTLPKKHGISILIETFHYLYTQNIETSDSEWHFTKLKWHFFELKWHFTVVKCHFTDGPLCSRHFYEKFYVSEVSVEKCHLVRSREDVGKYWKNSRHSMFFPHKIWRYTSFSLSLPNKRHEPYNQ